MEILQDKTIVVLGAGLTGLTLARELSEKSDHRVVLVEKEGYLGGLAATLSERDLSFDLGSHRLHSAVDPGIRQYMEDVLGEPLLKRPRHGRLYLEGRFLDYPPSLFSIPGDILFKIALGLWRGYRREFFSRSRPVTSENFESAMVKKVGRPVYESFYRDYARKLWGLDPREVAVSGMKKKMIFLNPGSIRKHIFKTSEHFFYPRAGIGMIADRMARKITAHGGMIIKKARPEKMFLEGDRVTGVGIVTENGERTRLASSLVLSTLAIDELFGLLFEDGDKKSRLCWRGVRLMYVLTDSRVENGTDTYYFPGLGVNCGRVSDIRKFSPELNAAVPGCLLTMEFPCSEGDRLWDLTDEELLGLGLSDLKKTGVLSDRVNVLRYFSRKLPRAYPLMTVGWDREFRRLNDRLSGIHNLFSLGRGGLFLPCNMDQCIIQARELAALIIESRWQDRARWAKKTAAFMEFGARD
jgi:protoporphyrinogen oxidase